LLALEQLSLPDGESPRSYIIELKSLFDLAEPGHNSSQTALVPSLSEWNAVAIRASPECSSSEAALARALALINAKEVPGASAAIVDGDANAATSHPSDLAERMDQLERELTGLRIAGASVKLASGNSVAVVTP